MKNTQKLFYSSLKDDYQPESYFDVLQNNEIRKQQDSNLITIN